MESAPLQLAYRTQKTIGIVNAAPVYSPLTGFEKPEGNLRCCAYSPCGRLFGWASPETVHAVDTTSGRPLTVLPIANVLELGFSPRGSFLITWERPGKDEAGDATKNLKVWRAVEYGVDSSEKGCLGKWVQKSQGGWNLQYTADEKFCARMVKNEVQFYESFDLVTVWSKLRVEGVADFAIAPGLANSVAVFVPEHKGQPAAVKLFTVPQFASPLSQKTFFKGDKVLFKWNSQGTALLVLAQTDVDKTNKSYYGETTLYLLTTDGTLDARVTLDKEGPIHDVSWSPNSKEFGVVYGYMPAKTTIFNHRAIATHSFPIGPRNTIIFSPTGRFALIAGFGNLAGQMDLFDLEKDFRKVCTIEGGNPSVCQWSPDGRYIMTATTSPRLRVDNGVKIWHVGGSLMYTEDMVELYNVIWKPAYPESITPLRDTLYPVPEPHESAVAYLGSVKTPSKQAGVYRPPGARGLATPLHFKREDEGGSAHIVSNGTPLVGPNGFGRGRRIIPGAELIESDSGLGVTPTRSVPGLEPMADISRTALKNKKKRNKKRKDDLSGGAGQIHLGVNIGQRDNDDESEHFSTVNQERNGVNNRGPPRGSNRRNRSNTQPEANDSTEFGEPIDSTRSNPGPGAPEPSQNPNAKRMRSLTKKVRAIEDLEMRLASGEKLEDTQLKKITTKDSVQKELDALEKLMAAGAPDPGQGG